MLIQLCDAISGSDGVMDIIERMSDVRRRYGNYDREKWNRNLELKTYFENRMHRDLYDAVEKGSFHSFPTGKPDENEMMKQGDSK